MQIKKIFFTGLFVLSAGYFLYDISLKSIDKFVDYTTFLSVKTLPDTLYLHTGNGRAVFHRVHGKKYCQIDNCGYIEHLTKNGFDFYWEKHKTLSFTKSNDEKNVYILKSDTHKNKTYITPQISFNLKYNNTVLRVLCQADNCQSQNEKLPFQFVVGAKKITPDMPFDKNYSPNASDVIILSNKDGNEHVFHKKDNVFEEISAPKQTNRFLFIISSYKRPIYLTGLVSQLKLQSIGFNHFDISISLKGVNNDVYNHMIEPDFKPLILNNKLLIRQDENKNQFSNMLDALRDINLSNYDYICKIDDDDWYHKDYLKNINLILNATGHPAFLTSGIISTLKKDVDEVYLKTALTSRTGPSICFSNTFAKQLFEIEQMSNEQVNTLLKSDFANGIKNVYEDLILNQLAHQKNEKFIYFSLKPLFIYNQTNQSIMRPN